MRTGIALGSNIEPRLDHLREAGKFLHSLHEGDQPWLASGLYETAPLDCPAGSGDFYNAVLEIETSLEPLSLLAKLQDFEHRLGRPDERPRNSPRPIDLDILYMGPIELHQERLVIPHPALAERRFVLTPLAEIRPALVLPGLDQKIETLLANLSDEQGFCRRVADYPR